MAMSAQHRGTVICLLQLATMAACCGLSIGALSVPSIGAFAWSRDINTGVRFERSECQNVCSSISNMSCQLDGCCVTFPKDAVRRASVKTQLSAAEKQAVSCLIDQDRLPDWAKRRKLVVQSGGNGESKFTTACKWIGAGGLDLTPPSWAPISPAKVSLVSIES
jgi:hypothetical protein